MNIPSDCRYTKDHEWVRLDDGLAVIGITDYAQGELGDIVFVEVDVDEGDEIGAEDPFGTVEAVKTVSELFAPLAGTMEAINEALEDAPETVNSDPYGEGWMIKIRPADEGDLDGLMSAEEYAHMIGADS
ncbi:MAG TPA: glycine cleavage system protein GcvH [Bacteroidetes bacterium]|nr:glycine cleavage system protein GcvH [Bacteroidota bacterium]HIL57586.1 glycine cleavage system protein GcvH [Rhodothermales bacterium]